MLESIGSTKNEYIRLIRKLKTSKGRRESGLFIAEGEKCAAEAMEYGYAEAVLAIAEGPLLQTAEQKGIRAIHVNEAVYQAVSTVKSGQGILAVARRKAAGLPEESGIFVALEDVSDPQNVGTIIRTADAVGASAVLLSATSADYTSPKAVRASMGSVFHIPIVTAQDFLHTIAMLRQRGVRVVAGHLCGEEKLEPCSEVCVLIGNEARGLSDAAAAMADVLCRIPIYGKAESLNAAVAAGILLYRLKG